jgi:4-hydroxy-2-oxoheptanedioate aldolase
VTALGVLRSRLAAFGPVFGGWTGLGGPLAGEILAGTGFDYVCVDLQHGTGGLESAPAVLQGIAAAGSVPLLRVPGNEPWVIMRALDLGAFGVIVPLVSTADEAARAAGACRYPPDGSRSWGPVRTAGALGSTAPERNASVLCFVMIETRAGVDNLETICATPGVDGIYVGPRDLGLAYGLELGSPELTELTREIATRCRQCGVPAGIHVRSGEAGRAAIDLGFAFASLASDRDLLARVARRELADAVGHEPERRPSTDDDLLRAAASYS